MAKKASPPVQSPPLALPSGQRAARGMRLLADMMEGQQLSKSDYADAEFAHRRLIETIGPVWATSLPLNQLAKYVGAQSTQLNPYVSLGVTALSGTPVDLIEVVRQCFNVIKSAKNYIEWSREGNDLTTILAERESLLLDVKSLRAKIQEAERQSFDDDEPEENDALTAAKIRRMEALALSSEVDLKTKAGQLVRACEVLPVLSIIAERIRNASEILGQNHGPDAQAILVKAVEDAERRTADLRKRLRLDLESDGK